MDSDEEIRLVNEMEDLRSQLKDAGHPIDPNSSEIFYRSLANKSTPADRIPKFRNQIQVLRQRLERHSGSAAVSPVVAHHDQRQKDRKRKADSPSEPEIQLHEAKVADGKKKKHHNYIYKVSDDGSPPLMCPSHVHFIRMSVDELKKERDQCLQVQDLLDTWNTSKRQEYGGRKLTKSLFNNNYITLELLRRISSGSLPLPVPYDALPPGRIKSEDDGACAQNAGNGVMRKRGRPSMRAGESDR